MSGDPKGDRENDTTRGISGKMTDGKGLPKGVLASPWPAHPLPAPPIEEPEEENPSVHLTYDETMLLRETWLRYGNVVNERLSGDVDHDLDVLARAVLFLRTSPGRDVGRDSSMQRQPEILRRDPLYQQLLDGPITRHYNRWDKDLAKIPSNPKTTPIRLKQGETVEAVELKRRQLAWLYAKYGIDDWGDWYERSIKPAKFLGRNVIWGLHQKAAKALNAAEDRVWRRIEASKEKDLVFASTVGPLGGGYNVRGWNGQLGAHDFGMAFDFQAGALNIEVRGAPGIAWATYAEGKNLIFIVKLLTDFDVYAFAKLYSKYEYDIKNKKSVPADFNKVILPEIKAAMSASANLKAALEEEIKYVRSLGSRVEDIASWEEYRIHLLEVARTIPDSKKMFPPILTKAVRDPQAIHKYWEPFLERLKESPVIKKGFFNMPIEIIESLIDPTAPANLRFHWVPFHHFQVASWREDLRSEGIQFP